MDRFLLVSKASAVEIFINPDDMRGSETIFLVLSSWAILKDIKCERAEPLFENCHCTPAASSKQYRSSENFQLDAVFTFFPFMIKQICEKQVWKVQRKIIGQRRIERFLRSLSFSPPLLSVFSFLFFLPDCIERLEILKSQTKALQGSSL